MDIAAPLTTPTMPLTEAQEGLWYAQALDPGNPILNTGQYLDLRGAIDLAALQTALTLTITETEALHLRFSAAPDGPRQWLAEDLITPEIVDLRNHPTPEAEALSQMCLDSALAVDLANDPIAAFSIFVLGPERCLLYERIHHLAIDGYGMVLITNRIGQHYSALINGTSPSAPFPPLLRAAEEDTAYRHSDRREIDKAWWHDRLSTLPEVTGPAKGRAVSGPSFIRESSFLSPGLLAGLAKYADQLKLGWPDILNALTAAYLARWSESEIVIGLPFMARMGRSIARLPCMAMNVLPQHVRPDENAPLTEWLPKITKEMQQARRHGLYRSEYLRRELGLVGGTRRLYGPLINIQPFDRPPEFSGLSVGLHILGAGAVDDLTLTFRGDPANGMLFEVDANPTLYSPEDIAGHSARLPEFIATALSATCLAEVPTASPVEIATINQRHDAARHPLPDTTLTQLIEAQLAATPDAPALTFGDQTLSYAELDRRSAALAAHLQRIGAGPDKIIAVALERSLELPVALLAIFRSGAAYLPLDPEHPPERLARILDMSKPVCVLTSADLADRFSRNTPQVMTSDWPQEGDIIAKPASENLAYVIYTSGSTGDPKGVMIEHRAIVNRLQWMAAHYDINATDRVLQKTPASFDVSVWEFFLPMITGAELVMLVPGAHRDPTQIAEAIRKHNITTLHFVPSMLSAFLASPASDGLHLRRVFCSGEELTADQRNRFHRRISAELHNLYGPTEAAVDVSYWSADRDDNSDPIPIGWPVWNTRLEVLDDHLRPVPPGLSGNLYLGGVQLARGYLGRDDLTAERFIPDPHHPGERLYATGDLARLRDDGAVIFLGRSDYQVKIRGLRIELGEIEAAIMATGLACEAVVLAREDHAGDKRLVAYLVPADSYHPNTLLPQLAATLPAYMLPGAEVVLKKMPVTSSGKLDRKALPLPVFTATGRAANSETETFLARLFTEILHLPDLPPAEADFFALGGDSLSAVRLILRIEEETGVDPGLGALFENPILSQLAATIDAGAARDDGLGPLILLADGATDAAPLFLIHPAGGLCWGYRHLARRIAPARRVWGLQHPGLNLQNPRPGNIKKLAKEYVERIIALAPEGPIHLAGWSVGGIIAHEMAVQLNQAGREIGVVAALDSYPADAWRSEPEPDPIAALRALLAIAGYDPDAHQDLDSRDKIMAFLRASDTALGALPDAVLDGVVRTVTDTNRLVRGHYHDELHHELTHFRAANDHKDTELSPEMWAPYAATVRVFDLQSLHSEMTSPNMSEQIAARLIKLMT